MKTAEEILKELLYKHGIVGLTITDIKNIQADAINHAIKIAEGYQIEDKHPHAYYINGTAMRIAAALDDLLKP